MYQPPVSENLIAALEYAAQGWHVFPLYEIAPDGRCACGRECSSPGKHPRTPRGVDDATIDEGCISDWWTGWPHANVGIATGSESNLVVVDIDPRHRGDENLQQLELHLGALDPALVANTGGGGFHYFFAHPGVKVRNRAPLPGYPGVDLKGDRGYVVAPPSNHVSGGRYSWAGDTESLSTVPSAIVDLANREPEVERLTYESETWDGKLPVRVEKLLPDSPRLFRRLLERSTEGLDDTTASGVDFSVATLLAQEELTGPEIEAAIRWSRMHSSERAKGESYYRATVEKALGVVEGRGATDDEESCVPPRGDRYVAFINGRPDRRASYEQIKAAFKVSDRTLRRDLAAEESGLRRLRRFKDGHQWYLTVRRGSGLKAIRWDAPVAHEMREAAHLPPGFKRFIGPERGLPPNTFVLYQAFGDGFKTSFLINTAIENAKAGLRVVFVSHENNVDTFRQLIARRILGGAPLSSEEAREACSKTDWMQRLELKVADGSVHVDEFIDQLAEDRPDVIVYDYLNQSLIMVDKADQQSSLANIVQRLGQGLVDRGTPLFTAVQLSTDKGKPYAPETWQQRATVVLRAGVPVADADTGNRVVDLTILKNKAGSDRALTRCLRMEVCGLSHRIVRVEGVKGSPPDESDTPTDEDVLRSLPDSFSRTELRKLLAARLGHSKDHPRVREMANLQLSAWEAKRFVAAVGGVWKKFDPEAPPTPFIFKRPIQQPTFDIPPPPSRPEDPSGQAVIEDPQADTGLKPADSPGAEVTEGHTSPSGSKV